VSGLQPVELIHQRAQLVHALGDLLLLFLQEICHAENRNT
jgi:hypothetical protein